MRMIDVYNKDGDIVNSIDLKDTINYVDGSVSKGEKCYYKGFGIAYVSHNLQP